MSSDLVVFIPLPGTSAESTNMIEVNVGEYDDCLEDGT